MGKFDKPVKTGKTVVTNKMGEKAYKDTPKEEIVNILLTSFVEDSYYEKSESTLKRFTDLIKNEKDKEFLAKAAIFARTEFGMRSITHVASAEIAKAVKCASWTKSFHDKVVYRVDDILEILSYYMSQYKKPLPNSLKRGLANAFGKFDSYQLAKYKKDNSDLSLIDAVNLLHPKPTPDNAKALKELVEGKLKATNTWEAKLTKAGQTSKTEEEKVKAKSDAWEELINAKKLGYFAALRNCRNIIEQAPHMVDKLCGILTNEKMIAKSLVLPFRFVSAYKSIEEMANKSGALKFESDNNSKKKVLNAIDKAINLSIQNIPKLPGKTVILSDNSGSMTGDHGGKSLVSKMSCVTSATIANLFATMYWMKCNDTFVGMFGDNLKTPEFNRDLTLFENFKKTEQIQYECGAATEEGIYTAFEQLIKDRTIVDRIVIFSDCQIGAGTRWYDRRGRQGWGSFQKLYKAYKEINPACKIYSINLKGYGDNVFSNDIIKLSGWSEKIFDIMRMSEQNKKVLFDKINNIEL